MITEQVLQEGFSRVIEEWFVYVVDLVVFRSNADLVMVFGDICFFLLLVVEVENEDIYNTRSDS